MTAVPSDPTNALVWLSEGQRPLARALAALANLSITHVGSPDASAGAHFAQAMAATHATDLRAAVVSAPCKLALILDPGSFASSDTADKQALLEARDRGTTVITLEPMPASLADLGSENVGPGAWARLCPLSRLTRPVREALDMLPAFGTLRSASITLCGSQNEGSLGFRLLDAMDLLLRFFDATETIDATYSAPSAPPGAANPSALRAVPGESLRTRGPLHGDLSLAVRFGGGRGASVLLSDQTASAMASGPAEHHRAITLLGAGGMIVVTPKTCQWTDPAGKIVDKSRPRPLGSGLARSLELEEPISLTAYEMAAQIRALLDGDELAPGSPAEFARALALAQTALLSSRTAEGESPETLQRIAGVH